MSLLPLYSQSFPEPYCVVGPWLSVQGTEGVHRCCQGQQPAGRDRLGEHPAGEGGLEQRCGDEEGLARQGVYVCVCHGGEAQNLLTKRELVLRGLPLPNSSPRSSVIWGLDPRWVES